MSDTKLLDGNVKSVLKVTAGLSKSDAAALLSAEREGKKRAGVITALEKIAGTEGKADTGVVAPAEEFAPSGAPMQDLPDVDPANPAVDDNPRSSASAEDVKIDFNDPTVSDEDAVARNLQG